jgi:hypothetical protein
VPGAPLFSALALGQRTLASELNPVFLLTTGARVKRPGERYIFFDKPADEKNGPVKHFVGTLDLTAVKVESEGRRVAVRFSRLSAGPFSGDLVCRFYADSSLVEVEAALTQEQNAVAYLHDAVLEGDFKTIAWMDTSDHFLRVVPEGEPRPVAVRHRAIMAESDAGTLAVFPPPHAFFFPRDYTTNFKFAQVGRRRFGLRQDPVGGAGHQGQYTPWFDAPAGRIQHMKMFILLSGARAEDTLEQVKRFTHGDAFAALPGYKTLVSHWHGKLTVNEKPGSTHNADFVRLFRRLGVDLFHLAEFHGDGHPQDPGATRLRELNGMFEVCRKYSTADFRLLPGEEANFAIPGHWIYLFPKPVYLTLGRAAGKPLAETIAPYGTVYHPQTAAEMAEVLRRENGLAWTTHPRIKASFAYPDGYKDTDWYKSDLFLGGTWKAMPGDLSDNRLGVRSLDLLDDMNHWGQHKVVVGEVDCFDVDETHELYGNMNVNYLRLAELPPRDDWSSVLDVLRRGDFFVTTGEVLLHSVAAANGTVRADISWTLPLAEVDLVVSDGVRVERCALPMADTTQFERRTFEWPADLTHARWWRLEAWDIAADGAFTQPVYLPGKP